jgi:ATP-binding protein involved in chromosome partitioning
MALDREQVISALKTVNDPELNKDLVTLNMVKDVKVEGADVQVLVELTTPACPLKETIRRDVEEALRKIGAQKIQVDFSAQNRGPAQPSKDLLPQVKHILAVGAGKGGVGKSTVAVNLAVGLALNGAQVGLMDGDVYGPSIPTMLGIKGLVPRLVEQNKIAPMFVHGIHTITIGSLVEEDKPLIWRGPMAQGAFRQLLTDNTQWPELDYLVVDLPPGTGDVPLTLCQLLPLSGAVVVATPQQVALDDAIRAVHMFEVLNVPVLGIVENMSYYVAPDGSEHDIFGRGGAEKAAQQLGLPYLGGIPMFPELRVNSDAGNPKANFSGNPKLKSALQQMVNNIVGQVSLRSMQAARPELNIV